MRKENHNRTLIIGIGNASRGDDALGWRFLESLEGRNRPDLDLEYRYQLQIEDADLIKNYQKVVFVDAYVNDLPDGFEFRVCPPDEEFTFSTHAISPGSVMALVREIFPNEMPRAYCLLISGYQWDLDMPVSDRAEANFEKAFAAFEEIHECLHKDAIEQEAY